MELVVCRMAATSRTSSTERPELGYESMNHFTIDASDAAAALMNIDFCCGWFRPSSSRLRPKLRTNKLQFRFKPIYSLKYKRRKVLMNVTLIAGVADDEETEEESEVDFPSS